MEERPTLIHPTAFIHPSAEVEAHVYIGAATKIWRHTHIRQGAVIGADCTIGANVFIDADVRIGNQCKIQNNVSLYRGVTLDDEVFIGPSVVTTNDLRPRAVGDWRISTTHFAKGCSICAGSVIVCDCYIGSYAMVAAGSVVTRNVPAYTMVKGNPARPSGYVCSCGKPMRPVASRRFNYRCMTCEKILIVSADLEATKTAFER